MLKIKINIILDEKFAVYAKVLFIKIKLFPKDKKNKKPKRPSNKKVKGKKEKKKTHAVQTDENQSIKLKIVDYIKITCDVVKLFSKKFAKHLHIKLAKIYIRVATDDAAQTAILYGVIAQALSYLIEALDTVTNLDSLKKAYINVEPDYLSDKFDAKINITLSVRVFGLLDVGINSLVRFLKLQQRAKAIRQARERAEQIDSPNINNENKNIQSKG